MNFLHQHVKRNEHYMIDKTPASRRRHPLSPKCHERSKGVRAVYAVQVFTQVILNRHEKSSIMLISNNSNWIHHHFSWGGNLHRIWLVSFFTFKKIIRHETPSSIWGLQAGYYLQMRWKRWRALLTHTGLCGLINIFVMLYFLGSSACACVCLSRGGAVWLTRLCLCCAQWLLCSSGLRHFLKHFLTHGNINCLFHWG